MASASTTRRFGRYRSTPAGCVSPSMAVRQQCNGRVRTLKMATSAETDASAVVQEVIANFVEQKAGRCKLQVCYTTPPPRRYAHRRLDGLRHRAGAVNESRPSEIQHTMQNSPWACYLRRLRLSASRCSHSRAHDADGHQGALTRSGWDQPLDVVAQRRRHLPNRCVSRTS
jgi:hypothetical protein